MVIYDGPYYAMDRGPEELGRIYIYIINLFKEILNCSSRFSFHDV